MTRKHFVAIAGDTVTAHDLTVGYRGDGTAIGLGYADGVEWHTVRRFTSTESAMVTAGRRMVLAGEVDAMRRVADVYDSRQRATWHHERDGFGTVLSAERSGVGTFAEGYEILAQGMTLADAVKRYTIVENFPEAIPVTVDVHPRRYALDDLAERLGIVPR